MNPAKETLLSPFHTCRNRSCAKSGYFHHLRPSGSEEEAGVEWCRAGPHVWEGAGEVVTLLANDYFSQPLLSARKLTYLFSSILSMPRCYGICNFCPLEAQHGLLETVTSSREMPVHLYPPTFLADPNLFILSRVPIVSSDKQGPGEQLKLSINNL